MENPQTWFAVVCKKHIELAKVTDVFFLCLFLNFKTKNTYKYTYIRAYTLQI